MQAREEPEIHALVEKLYLKMIYKLLVIPASHSLGTAIKDRVDHTFKKNLTISRKKYKPRSSRV